MKKKSTLSLLLLSGASLLMGSCGGSGTTESSDLNAGDILSFIMGSGHGTITIQVVSPTSGIVTYLGVGTVAGQSQSFTSNDAISFFYRPSTASFGINFVTGSNWHIDPGPVTVDYQMNCSFSAILTPSWENNAQKNGSMEYSFDRWASNDGGHPVDDFIAISVAGQTGTFGITYTAL